MASQVEITNLALISLGMEPITGIDDTTKEARYAKTLFPLVKKRVLRSHPWNVAIKRASLAALSSTPVFEYTYQFQLPSDCIRLLEVYQNDDWKLEGNVVLTSNGGPLYIKYIYDITHYDSLDESLVYAIAAALAVDLCMALQQNANQRQVMMEEYEMRLREARGVDAKAGSSLQTLEINDWIQERF